MGTFKDREEFAHIMGKEGVSFGATRDLMRLARRYHRLQEAACNGYPQEAAELRIEERVRTLCIASSGIVPVFSGDPRGATLKVKVPSGRTNDLGQIGICVPS